MERMDSRTFSYWVAFNSIEPNEDDKVEFHLCRILLTILRVFSKNNIDLKDVLVDWWKKEEKVDANKVMRTLKNIGGIKWQ